MLGSTLVMARVGARDALELGRMLADCLALPIVAAQTDSDLIGSARRESGSLLAVVGQDAAHLFDSLAPHATAVAIAPLDYAARYALRLSRVIVAGFDASETAIRSLLVGGEIAHGSGGHLRVVPVDGSPEVLAAAERALAMLPPTLVCEIDPPAHTDGEMPFAAHDSDLVVVCGGVLRAAVDGTRVPLVAVA